MVKFQKIRKSLLQFLYPNFCPVCETPLTAYELLCEPCGEAVLLEQDSYCHQCGKVRCMCKYRQLSYDKAVVACRYDKTCTPAIAKLKSSENTNFAYFSAEILAERLKSEEYGKVDMVVPVPMHWAKRRMRGYNQAELIAVEIAQRLHLPCQKKILCKQNSVEQHRLNAQERAVNVKHFQIGTTQSLAAMHIILCDDVLTTGNTCNRCAALLKQAGAASVTVAVATTTTPDEPRNTEIPPDFL